MKTLASRAVIYSLLILLGLLSALPNVLPDAFTQKLPHWYQNNTVELGLDLRGGSHLLLNVDTKDLQQSQHQQLVKHIKIALEKARGIGTVAVIANSTHIEVTPENRSEMEAVQTLVRSLVANAQGASDLTLKADGWRLLLRPTTEFQDQLAADAVEKSLEVVRRRLDETGLVEPSITRQGRDGILVQLPGVDNPQHIRELLGTTAKMSFHWAALDPLAGSKASGNTVTRFGEQGEGYRLEQQVALEGKHISDAQLSYQPETGEPVVTFRLDNEGARLLADLTQNNIGRPLHGAVGVCGLVIRRCWLVLQSGAQIRH